MPYRIRLTVHVAAVLSVLASNPGRRWSATEIADATGMFYASVRRIAQRLHEAGYASTIYHEHRNRAHGQSSNFYQLSPYGRQRAESMLRFLRDPAEALHTWQADDLEIPDGREPNHRHLKSVG